ncbi:MAG: hypothetical protein M1823_004321 [Watsoniomyces obsoletus]|nr:MAG: hypothetical protein M1823_004321 [Watsoniomyces obsoletus]
MAFIRSEDGSIWDTGEAWFQHRLEKAPVVEVGGYCAFVDCSDDARSWVAQPAGTNQRKGEARVLTKVAAGAELPPEPDWTARVTSSNGQSPPKAALRTLASGGFARGGVHRTAHPFLIP